MHTHTFSYRQFSSQLTPFFFPSPSIQTCTSFQDRPKPFTWSLTPSYLSPLTNSIISTAIQCFGSTGLFSTSFNNTIINTMQSKKAFLSSSAASWRSRRNKVCHPTGASTWRTERSIYIAFDSVLLTAL